ncbi:hypothetical protein [Blastococcus sp. SYSU D00820]
MSLLLTAVPLVLVVVGGLALTARRSPAGAARTTPPRLRAVARTTTVWRLAGLGVGLVAAGLALATGALGRGLLLAAPALALGVLAGVLIGELRVSAPAAAVRSAALEVRLLRHYLPRRLGVTVGVAGALLGLLLVWTTAMGSADDLGRPGRWLTARCGATVGEARGPWPGSYYSLPLALLVVAGLAAAGWALLRVTRRPRQGEDDAVDDLLRARSAEAVTAAAGLLVSVPLAGVAAVAANALGGMACLGSWAGPVAVTLVAVSLAALSLAATCAVALAVPSGERRRVPVA